MKILAIVPAYNEEKNIVEVIKSIKVENPKIDIIVINDGSRDKTGELAESTGQAYVVNLPCNLGIGGAVQTGFKFAKQYNYDIAFQFDADGQHIASEINKLLDVLKKHEADVVIGSRFFNKNNAYKSAVLRRLGQKVFKVVNSIIIKQWITDNTSGFRAFNKRTIHFLADNYPIDYPEPEVVILLGKNGFKIVEVFTYMRERLEGSSSITGFKTLYYMIKVLLAIFMSAIRPKILKD